MATLVMKFGGSLTSDARRLTRVAQVIAAESLAWDRMVVVISAMAGATDLLTRCVNSAAARDATSYRKLVGTLRRNHTALIDVLFTDEAQRRDIYAYLDRQLFDVLAICDTICDTIADKREALPRHHDLVMAAGERIMAEMVTVLVRLEGLNSAYIDAATLIVTDDRHLGANPIVDEIDQRVEQVLIPLLENNVVPIVTGFIGSTRRGAVTTLGRGGSDYTATLLAAALHADEVWIWTNVDGVMSADPVLVPSARVIPMLSYTDVGALSFFGAHVIHPRAAEPLITEKIPLRVRNPFNLDHAGTLIQADSAETEPPFKAVTAVDGLYFSTERHKIDLAEVLAQVQRFAMGMATGPVMLLQSHQQSTLVFVVPTSAGPTAAPSAAQRLQTALGSEWRVEVCKVVAVMGSILPTGLDLSGLGVQPLISALSRDGQRLVAVTPADVQPMVRHLHKLTYQQPVKPPYTIR